jgi:DNA-damage-inducible protein J
MTKTANINIRIDPETKARAEQLFANFGITVSDAVNIFLHQSLMVGGLPFDMKQPGFNVETEAAMQEAKNITSGKISTKSYTSARELFDELDRER